ncbi:MAG TPA: DUF1003 domain-containing protein [Flavobacterium sp.]|jgi:uncharacterized membrane protein
MKTKDQNPQMTKIVERNINVLIERRKEEGRQKSTEERIADTITGFTGSMKFVYLHLFLFGLWIIWNLGWLGLKPFDPSFVVLAMIASVEAIFLSTFVLISQNRMNVEADKRDELNLQISLLTEHEVTRIISIVRAMAQHHGVNMPGEHDIADLEKDVMPENVMDTIEKVSKEKLDK